MSGEKAGGIYRPTTPHHLLLLLLLLQSHGTSDSSTLHSQEGLWSIFNLMQIFLFCLMKPRVVFKLGFVNVVAATEVAATEVAATEVAATVEAATEVAGTVEDVHDKEAEQQNRLPLHSNTQLSVK